MRTALTEAVEILREMRVAPDCVSAGQGPHSSGVAGRRSGLSNLAIAEPASTCPRGDLNLMDSCLGARRSTF